MNSMKPKSIEDRLGFFTIAQLNGLPVLFAADGNGHRDRRRATRGMHRFASGLWATARRRRRVVAVAPEPGVC